MNRQGPVQIQQTSTAADSAGRILQRKCACGNHTVAGGTCEECSKEAARLPREADDLAGSTEAPPIVHQVLRSPGEAVDPNTRVFMESRFGHDFSRVRVHTDAQAAASARAVNALAYTVGRDVVFGQGEYAPHTTAGRRLMAHELTHTIQQGHGTSASEGLRIGDASSSAEREAGDVADDVMSRGASDVTPGNTMLARQTPAPVLQRQPLPPPPATLAGVTATRVAFNNAGAPDPANCAVALPAALGVDGPAVGENGMEMIFEINGAVPAGTEFDITRTRATGTWQQDGGVWTRIGGDPAGTNDDHHDDDECLRPVANRIFVIDTPGIDGTLNPRGVVFGGSPAVSATATDAVRKASFAEWVIARNRPLGIDWTRISRPVFHRWHSTLSVSLVAGVWTRVNTPNGDANEIELGAIATTGNPP